MNLKKFQKDNLLRLICNLKSLKTCMRNPEIFRSLLMDLSLSYSLAYNSLGIRPPDKYFDEFKDGVRIKKYNNFTFICKDDLILDLPNYSELAPIFVGDIFDIDFVSLYFDFEYRCCDICGRYLSRLQRKPPIIRIPREDYASAYHEDCREF